MFLTYLSKLCFFIPIFFVYKSDYLFKKLKIINHGELNRKKGSLDTNGFSGVIIFQISLANQCQT